jgi:hypothetical protein
MTERRALQVRAAQNQSLFREVNERIDQLGEDASKEKLILCECARVDCQELIRLEPELYRSVRAAPDRFFVRPGHVVDEAERVVDEGPGFVVVQKIEAAATTARKLDPRTRSRREWAPEPPRPGDVSSALS